MGIRKDSPMAKYIPQYLFDGLVANRMIADLASDRAAFDMLIHDYAEKYPDEDIPDLVADIKSAAMAGRPVIQSLIDAGIYGYESDAIGDVMKVLEKAAALQKPMWRRMLENALFAVQPAPITDRIAKAREHLVAAGNVLKERAAPVR